ncbi:MAG: sigma-54-dependent Fis family transcriptional regulator [Candidatus Sedimenticola endophacoides]|uniref:Sigma-54-dependent Fis family transcriptional regulator n=1 Tax=Candidatus Sedimenticola endophacoides TaxID=2548426 RepID=A0A657PL31_9GAMM|nr:MAG: sigma-54-dependent Fis family transcriptional regulator [Candidatus Sedimenticola endophacoides]OQX37325.1 MAG: sigma-54-dependent Fis family transcriptional regulator [Candidatus Sedimenticola endophacoides]OQX38440.1 MAG: sigma-54-dependent Fis family transcriptional regulator [Candidatus Sedimenticola endophacoides]OQX38445.1 MAG: sigma-54-dependent Fis family transcriptional regulator [Candidatus Sedimenticola endophacoides]OQX38873.1 MAG: sigma-54-dependent Fis family transcription
MRREMVLVVEDDPALREALSDTLELAGYGVITAADGESALEAMRQTQVGMVVSDVQMTPMNGQELLGRIKRGFPSVPVLLMTAYGNIEKAVTAMRDGAVDYLAKPFEPELLLAKVEQSIRPPDPGDGRLVAEDLRTRELLELARRVAQCDATVMIGGESGTGKEVFARYIHRNSARSQGPFIAINCAAIPDNMLEAVLFGHEKGAYTGAYHSAPGKFEQAQGGTLLLDEISEMSLALQAKLLRVLQEREVERVGGRKLITLDVRVLATSNRNLREEVSAGRFREDLFYRLNVFPLYLPPLRERTRDVLPLARFLLRQHCRQMGIPEPLFCTVAEQRLLSHAWPGNVRELDNVVQRALILCNGHEIGPDDLSFEIAAELAVARHATAEPKGLSEDLRSVEEQMILDALRENNGSRKEVAERLGISQRTLRYKIARLRDAGVAIPG